MCADYRAAWHVDWPMDEADSDRRITCPVLALYGEDGLVGKRFNVEGEWRRGCDTVTALPMRGGHFFPDTAPEETALALLNFLSTVR